MLPAAKVVGQGPKIPRGHAQAGDKAVVLHILGAERTVKIIEQGNHRLFHSGPPPLSAVGQSSPLR